MKKTHALLITAGAIALLLVPKLSSAFLGFSDTKIILSYPCLGLDGVPITDATLSTTCCDGSGNLLASAPPACATSMYGAGISEATSGTIGAIQTAQSALDAANDLSGVTTNYASVSPTPAAGSSAVSSAITSSGVSSAGSSADTGNTTSGTSAANNASNNSGGVAGGSSGTSGSASGALGSTGGTGANVTPDVPSGEGADGGAYAKSAGGQGSSAGSGRKIGGLYGSLFGNNNSQGSGENAGGVLGARSGGSGDANGAAGLNGKDNLDGTTIDPADYFSRIDVSASLFKVVSNRYAKVNARSTLMK
jgi:hypothetical protein